MNRFANEPRTGSIPEISVEGTARECGEQLGYAWREAIQLYARKVAADSKPWWKDRKYARLIRKHAPHLPDIYAGMAAGGLVKEDLVGTRLPAPAAQDAKEGCTSFAIGPDATLDGHPISGQTKDNPINRLHQFHVLRMKVSDAPSMLSLTYAGWLFGHGFAEGRCSIFRNSLYAGNPRGGMPFTAWGLLAMHCKSVEDVVELTEAHGTDVSGHCAVADARGGIRGIEMTANGFGYLKPRGGIYTHANAVCASKRLCKGEKDEGLFLRADSLHRQDRLRAQLEPNTGRLTAMLAMRALADHDGYPTSICRHQGANALTCAAVVVEPTRGLLHATHGAPCRNWPKTYSL